MCNQVKQIARIPLHSIFLLPSLSPSHFLHLPPFFSLSLSPLSKLLFCLPLPPFYIFLPLFIPFCLSLPHSYFLLLFLPLPLFLNTFSPSLFLCLSPLSIPSLFLSPSLFFFPSLSLHLSVTLSLALPLFLYLYFTFFFSLSLSHSFCYS